MLILHHGTSKANLDSDIAVTGLKPRKGKGNWAKPFQVPSIKDRIYLSGDICLNADFYAARTALATGSDCCILTIDVGDGKNLWPDETFFAPNDKTVYDVADLKLMQQKAQEPKNKNEWAFSLEQKQRVAHHGPIPLNQIIDVNTYPIEESSYFSFVRGFNRWTLDAFELSYQIYMYLAGVKWFEKVKSTRLAGTDLIKRLDISPVNDTTIAVTLGTDTVQVVAPNFIKYYTEAMDK